MSEQNRPLLSIGIIFKNEIRCLERCLKSLEPLRKAVPCELVMGDTGSDDGSREIAERYADLVIAVPWTDDFAAARNAVMDRCSGAWYFSIDCDEWLDSDIGEMVRTLTDQRQADIFTVRIRNYKAPELENGPSVDTFHTRLLRMSTGKRYQGAIHEGWDSNGRPIVRLEDTLLHHDGYIYTDKSRMQEKETRNIEILRRLLEERPKDLYLLLQAYESSISFPEEHTGYLRLAVQGVEEEWAGWKQYGPAILRYAVIAAARKELPKFEELVDQAVSRFPDSILTRVDVSYTALGVCWDSEDYAGCVRWGEKYFQAAADYQQRNYVAEDVNFSPVVLGSPERQQSVRVILAGAYFKQGQFEVCRKTLVQLLARPISQEQIEEAVRVLVFLHTATQLDTVELIQALWEQVAGDAPSQKVKRIKLLTKLGYMTFKNGFRLDGELPSFRSPYSLFLPIADQCDLGRSAAILDAKDAETAASYLTQIENWDKQPISVLEHALELGVPFPLETRPLTLEEMDTLAGQMSRKAIVNLAIKAVDDAVESSWQSMIWARELALAAVQSDRWSETDRGMELCRAFTKIEGVTLPRYYGDEALKEENISTLPPAHRFGWYCVRAFEALDAGDRKKYMHLLRLGLTSCPSMKGVVEFLAAHTPEIKETVNPSSELLSLAEQVRTLLASFAPGDPALEAIRSSEAYRKVAYLIEGTDAGGLPS